MDESERVLDTGDVLKARYRITGEGEPLDIGTSYQARDLRSDRAVVLLVLAPRYASDPDAVPRIMQTQRALIELAVPELVPVDDAGVSDGRVFVVRHKVDGHTLADLQSERGYLPPDVAAQIAARLCDALAPLHRARLVHGSLSPFSVLVQDSGQVLVTDVGLLPALRTPVPSPGEPWGRAPYLSPEQAAGENAVPSSDVYVVGSLLYKMMTGRPPFQAKDEGVLAVRHLHHDPPSLQVLVPDIPPRLAEIVQKSLSKERTARYRNAGQLAHILRSQIETGQPGGTEPHTATPHSVTPARPSATPARPSVTPAKAGVQSPARTGPHSPAQAETGGRRRLVVPAPPIGDLEQFDRDREDWVEETAAADWLMVALIVAALIAVLGLIPLWRTVYHRYAAPATTPQGLYQLLPGAGRTEEGWVWFSSQPAVVAVGANASSKLDDFGLVWYNLVISNRPRVWTTRSGSAPSGLRTASIAHLIWESRLRVLGLDSDIL